MEKEITTTNQTTALADSLIVVQQLPIIKEQLHSIKAQAQESVKEALSLACTEETLKVVKERRAALNRDRKDLDFHRLCVGASVRGNPECGRLYRIHVQLGRRTFRTW